MKFIHFAASIVLLAAGLMVPAAAETPKRVLMVISSNGVDGGETQPGYELEEFAHAYLIFKQNHITVDVASPMGGKAEPDKHDPQAAYALAIAGDKAILSKLNDTRPLAAVDPSAYDAVFIVGGKGAMFDLPDHQPLQRLIAEIYDGGGVVSAVCHGPAALVNVTLSDGRYLVDGKSVNGFTNQEETLFSKGWVSKFDFLLEDRLKERGGRFEAAPMMLSHVAQDGRLITGQNPASTPAVAEALVRALGLTPAAREPFRDETTYGLIARFLDGDAGALTAYEQAPDDYNGPLLALYGYYFAQGATSPGATRQAIALMELVPSMQEHAQLQLQMARAYKQLDDTTKARALLQALLDRKPDFAQARALLDQL